MNEKCIIAAIFALTCLVSPAHAHSVRDKGRGDDGSKSEDRNDHSKSGESSKKRKVKYVSRLTSISDFASNSRAKAEYEAKNKEKKFKINLRVPFSESGIANLTEAQSLVIKATLSRAGTAYATCNLALGSYDDEDALTSVEFKVDLNKKEGRSLKKKKGSCSIGGIGETEVKGLPTVEDADTIVINEAVAGDFLSGEF